jgi:hypothetical protein
MYAYTSCDVRLNGVAAYVNRRSLFSIGFTTINCLIAFGLAGICLSDWSQLLPNSVRSCDIFFKRRCVTRYATYRAWSAKFKPNPFHSASRQTSHPHGMHLHWLVVRFFSLSQSYLTHDYLVSSSGLGLCPYGAGTRFHEISIHLHVHKNQTSLIRKGAA